MSTASTPTVDAVTRKLGATRLKKVSTTNGKKELMKVSKVFRRIRIDDGGGGGDGYPAGAVGGGPVMKDYGKVRASFQCENEDCRKKWSSAHAWSTRLDQYCEGCESKAKVARLENEVSISSQFSLNFFSNKRRGVLGLGGAYRFLTAWEFICRCYGLRRSDAMDIMAQMEENTAGNPLQNTVT